MSFAVNVVVAVNQVANALAIETPVPMQLRYQKGKWRAQCQAPALASEDHDSMEAALIAGAEQVAAEVQAAVIERPLIVARITPDNIPAWLR